MKRKPYPSDLSDAQWAILKPLIPTAKQSGRPRWGKGGEAVTKCHTVTEMLVH